MPLGGLETTDGMAVEVLDPGLHNTDAGPDFCNAKVKIGGVLWCGCVEIHSKASDWRAHGHGADPRYDNVVLHVVGADDYRAETSAGTRPPQALLEVPGRVAENYAELMAADTYPPCAGAIPDVPPVRVHTWLNSLLAERLERKTADIVRRVEDCQGAWETACFTTLARSYGFGVNSDALEEWAVALPLQLVGRHRDDPFQVEAMFMGTAGLLLPDSMPAKGRTDGLADPYYKRMEAEYAFLKHKFSLEEMRPGAWKFLRLRPQNFPYIRLSQLAALYCSGRAGMSRIAECGSYAEAAGLVSSQPSEYWRTHYAFGKESTYSAKRLSAQSANVVVINAVAPLMFAYGRHKNDETLCDRAITLLEEAKAEDNHVTRKWSGCGVEAANGAESQALVQLKTRYCDRKDCLRCRFGYEYLKSKWKETHRRG